MFYSGILAFTCLPMVLAGIVEGIVRDAKTSEVLIGASIAWADGKGTSTDADGHYRLDIPNGRHTLTIRYIGYQTQTRDTEVKEGQQTLDIDLLEDNATLAVVRVTGEARHNTETALMREQQRIGTAHQAHAGQGCERGDTPHSGCEHHRREVRHGARTLPAI